MEKIIRSLLPVVAKESVKNAAWTAFCFGLFFFFGDYIATLLIQDWANAPIEAIPAHSGWIILRCMMIGLIALAVNKLHRCRKISFEIPSFSQVNWMALMLSFISFYLIGYLLTYIAIEMMSGQHIEALPARGDWLMFRTVLIGASALIARKTYYVLKKNDVMY